MESANAKKMKVSVKCKGGRDYVSLAFAQVKPWIVWNENVETGDFLFFFF